jgi:hypothetical protein
MTAEVIAFAQKAFVYVIGAKDGPQKIGIAQDAQKRLTSLQTGNHLELCIHSVSDVMPEEVQIVEKYAHYFLQSRHIRGEWFDVSPSEAAEAVSAAIDAIRSGQQVPQGKSSPIGFRVEPELKEALERAAKADDRSVSSLVERILKQWLTEKGFLPSQS